MDDRIARLRLIRTPGIGPVTFFQLLARFGSPQAALQAVPDLASRGGGRPPQLASLESVEREVARVEALRARHLFLGQGLYPPLLAELESAPPALIVSGDLKLLERMTVAIVGARNASAAACRFTRQLAYDLGQEGVTVASGLARGIDTAAHDGSLESGTIAVVAGGIDIFYPPENEARQRVIAERGVLVAEQPPGAEPPGQAFPVPQPDHRRAVGRHGGGGGRAQVGQPDHRAAGGRDGAGRDGGAGQPARPAGAGVQRPHPRGRDAGPERRGRAGGGAPRSGPSAWARPGGTTAPRRRTRTRARRSGGW